MQITGEQGRLLWGYYEAARLHPWTVLKTDGRFTLTATIERADTFKVSQRPLVFETPNHWRWPVVELQIAGASLSATLGPKEPSHVPIRHTPDRASTAQ